MTQKYPPVPKTLHSHHPPGKHRFCTPVAAHITLLGTTLSSPASDKPVLRPHRAHATHFCNCNGRRRRGGRRRRKRIKKKRGAKGAKRATVQQSPSLLSKYTRKHHTHALTHDKWPTLVCFPLPTKQAATEDGRKTKTAGGCSQSLCSVCSTESREEPSRPVHITTTSARTTRHGAGIFQAGGVVAPRSTCLNRGTATCFHLAAVLEEGGESWNRNVLPGIRGGRDADASRTEREREQAAHAREGAQEERRAARAIKRAEGPKTQSKGRVRASTGDCHQS